MVSMHPGSAMRATSTETLGALLDLKTTVTTHFPKAWPAVESCLSAIATLLLKDAADPTALILVGLPAGMKTTICNFFHREQWPFYRSDKFTSKAFVSHYAGVSSRKLADVDLLPRIRHRVLVTPELAPMFRGRVHDLTEHFSTLTRVLDGQGLVTDSGVHGQRGYLGDYFFVWLGASTPLPPAAWEIMAQLGSRLFFLPVPDDAPTAEELDDVIRGQHPFAEKVEACRQATSCFVKTLLPDQLAIRSVTWDRGMTPDDCTTAMGNLARLLACLRGVVPVIGRGAGNRPEFGPPLAEKPFRALQVLFNVARGHALLYGRPYLTLADVALVVPIALGSCPDQRRKLLLGLMRDDGRLTADEAARLLKVTTETARSYLEQLVSLGVVGEPKSQFLQVFELEERWRWFLSEEFKQLQAMDPSSAI